MYQQSITMIKYPDIFHLNKRNDIENLGFNLCNFVSNSYNNILEDLKDYKKASIFFKEFYEKIIILQSLILSIWELVLVDDNDLITIIKDNIIKLENKLIGYYNIIDVHYYNNVKNIFKLTPVKDVIIVILRKFRKVIRCCKMNSMVNITGYYNYITNRTVISSFINCIVTKVIVVNKLNDYKNIKLDAEIYSKQCIEDYEELKEYIDLFNEIIKISEQSFINQTMMMIIKLRNLHLYNKIMADNMINFSLKLASFQVHNKYN